MTKNELTVQQKITQLDELVAWFDSDEFSLESAMQMFKKAEQLAHEIEQDLRDLKNEIEVVKASFAKDSD